MKNLILLAAISFATIGTVISCSSRDDEPITIESVKFEESIIGRWKTNSSDYDDITVTIASPNKLKIVYNSESLEFNGIADKVSSDMIYFTPAGKTQASMKIIYDPSVSPGINTRMITINNFASKQLYARVLKMQ